MSTVSGFRVLEIVPLWPACTAGLVPYLDIIIGVNGDSLVSAGSLVKAMPNVGEAALFKVLNVKTGRVRGTVAVLSPVLCLPAPCMCVSWLLVALAWAV